MKKLRRESISEQVFQLLKEKIIKGDWGPGSKIPSENQLCELLDVSRVSIREAIHKMVALGILETRHGEGPLSGNPWQMHILMNWFLSFCWTGQILSRFWNTGIVEVGTIGIGVEKATAEDIKGLEEIYREMEKNKDNLKEFARLDLHFHRALADIADNPILNKVNYIINDILEETMRKIVEKLGSSDGLYYHNRIIEAIKMRDVTKAQEVMAEHLERTIARMSTP